MPRFNADLSIRGRFIRPDAVWDRERVIVELDGRAAHGTAARLRGGPRAGSNPPARGLAHRPRHLAPASRRPRGRGAGPPRAARPPGDFYPVGMSTELFEHFLRDESRRGPAHERAFTGAAGGAACGDLARISLAHRGRPGRLGHLRRRGLRRDPGGDGRGRRDGGRRAGARRGADRDRGGRRDSRRPHPGQAPRRAARGRCPPSRPRRRGGERGAAGARRGGPGRGRDVGRGRQRRRGAARTRARGRRRRDHGQALGRPGDRRRQGLLLARGGARRPLRRPLDRRPPPHPRSRGGLPPPGGRLLPLGPRGRRHPEPLHRLQRRGQAGGDGRPRRAPRRRAADHRPLRAHRRRRGRPAARRRRRLRPRTRATCSPACRRRCCPGSASR